MPHRVKGTPWPQQPEKAAPKPPKVTKAKQKHIDKENTRIDNLIKSMYVMNRRQRRRLATVNHLPMSVTPKYTYAESKKIEADMLHPVTPIQGADIEETPNDEPEKSA